MLHSIELIDFRNLKDIKINLGKYITAISGRNGLGKSTILALLGNTCEMKIKDGKTIFNSQFRTEFSEIFKASKMFDKSGSNKCRVNFCDINNVNTITENKICRTTWQNNGKRFRIIPETKDGINNNSRKMDWPSLYLGLSRLYPVGEVIDAKLKVKNLDLQKEQEYFIKNYADILNLNFDNSSDVHIDMIDIGDTERKKGIGINTDQYESITNSAGQDNVGQILTAILSFKKLKKENANYKGGLLLIDEIEATLHPIAQVKLINFLYIAAKELNLQIVFTTHSVSLLELLSQKIINNDSINMNDYEVYYCSKANGPLKFYRNPEFPVMKSDLVLAMPGSNIDKIAIYSEDKEARWLLNNLLKKYSMYIRCIDSKLPCSVLLQLNKNDPLYFANIIFVLDGDVQQQEVINSNKHGNIIKLPGTVRPEQVIYDFLLDLEGDSQLWQNGLQISFTKETIKEYGPYSDKYKGKEREKFKKWFNDNLEIFESLRVFDYWLEKNNEEAEKFVTSFKKAYNKIAKRKLQVTI
jgi:predicted ATPase